MLPILIGCGTPGLAVLPDGRTTSMDPTLVAVRTGLTLIQPPRSISLSYRMVRPCTFDLNMISAGRGTDVARFEVRMRAIRDRLQIVMTAPNRQPSSYLIDRNGRLLDFNAFDFFNPTQRLTSEQQSNTTTAATSINLFTVMFPEFLGRPMAQGEIAANVNTIDRQPWSQFRFAGTTLYQGREVAVLDLVRTESNGSTLRGTTAIWCPLPAAKSSRRSRWYNQG